jgi:sugar/nucleoside kinase (ribokinase family)
MRTKPVATGSTIVTVTMNPALDITTDTEAVVPTDKVRCGQARYDPGGGGINVARIAHLLGASVSAVFPAGGPTGDLVTDLVTASGVPVRRITIADSTRESVTVNERSTGRQYRFVLPGPNLTADEQTECLAQRHRQVVWECLWCSRCERIGAAKMLADCAFQAAAAVMISSQTAKRSVISVRHWDALIK